MRSGNNSIESYKASKGGDGLRIRDDLPRFVRDGWQSLSQADKDLLKWVGVFFRKPTPGKFMMRIRMPNGFSTSTQLRAIAELSRRLGNGLLDITTRQQVELRGFTIESVPEIWEKLRGVDLHSLQTGMDNIRNINGCPLAGLTPREAFDASPVLFELDHILVGCEGNPEFTNLPRKFNITVTGCLENCTHNESQDIALVPARKPGLIGFNILVGGKMGSGGYTIASSLGVFVEPQEAPGVVAELIRIYRDHGPRDARAKCRLAFLIQEWGLVRLRAELEWRLRRALEAAGEDLRTPAHADHLGFARQKQPALVAVGLCVPTGRVNPDQMAELACLADTYGNGQIRFTVGQNAVIPNVPASRVNALLLEPLLRDFSPRPSPFFRGLVACTGTDFCNLAQIETKQRAVELSQALEQRLGSKLDPLTIHWSGCPAGCGNHQASDIGLRGMKINVDGQAIDAVAIYAGGKTGPGAVAGQQLLDAVPLDEKFPDVVAAIIRQQAAQPGEPLPTLVSVDHISAPRSARRNGHAARARHPAPVSAIPKTQVCMGSELSEQHGRLFRVHDRDLAVFALEGKIIAMDAECPHAGGPLYEGTIENGCVVCPWHRYCFELGGGRCTSIPDLKVNTYPAWVEAGAVWVDLDGRSGGGRISADVEAAYNIPKGQPILPA